MGLITVEWNGRVLTESELADLLKDPAAFVRMMTEGRGNIERPSFGDGCSAKVIKNRVVKSGMKSGGRFNVECIRPDGSLRWFDYIENLVVNVGLQHNLDILFAGSTQVNPWYVGIFNSGGSVVAGDTMSSHAGWTENQNYSQAVRQEFIDVRTGQSVSNSASVAAFSINTNGQVLGGAFLTSSSTKGGATGTLLCGGSFSGGNKSADNGDTLQVTYTFTAADDGV